VCITIKYSTWCQTHVHLVSRLLMYHAVPLHSIMPSLYCVWHHNCFTIKIIFNFHFLWIIAVGSSPNSVKVCSIHILQFYSSKLSNVSRIHCFYGCEMFWKCSIQIEQWKSPTRMTDVQWDATEHFKCLLNAQNY